MMYIGKFINNFRDFYNEINSATLTGAIDVVVIRQPDGTYTCSPFHVRFGKIGVLRSREKVVDIEVNGNPVDIHMKLGESGEAFFVEEVEDEREIPAYLATSPLPDTPDIEAELNKLKQENQSKQVPDDPKPLITIPSPSVTCDKTSEETTGATPPVPVPQDPVETTEIINSIHTDSSEEYKTKRRRRKKVPSKKRSKPKEITEKKVDQQTFLPNESSNQLEDIFHMDDDYEVDEGYPSSSGGLSRSVSLPVASNINNLLGTEWNHRKLSSTFTGEFHPFSDGDVTPQSSPIGSRPPSPKSDTEYEKQKIDTGSPSSNNSGPSWGWGQLPNVPKKNSDTELPSNSGTELAANSNEEKDENVDAEKRSMLGGMLNFMRSTKKMRHMPESEGIYLSEINTDELDPELAALYFPKFKSTYGPEEEHVINDEDAESGKGSSLPHSPHTVESSFGLHGQDSDSDERLSLDHFSKERCESISFPYSDIAMSLCGGLADPDSDLSEERFMHSLVTFDEFTENPALLQDGNLVIRIGGKYYNWSTAASMLTSIVMFQRPLPEKTANQLINDHMPKKKKTKPYTSWWSWRRSETDIKPPGSEINPNDSTETKSEPSTEIKPDPSTEPPTESLPDAEPESVPEESNITTPDSDATIIEMMTTENITPTPVVDEEAKEEEELTEVLVIDDDLSGEVQENPVVIEIPAEDTSSSSTCSPIDIVGSVRPNEDMESLSPPETIAQATAAVAKEQNDDSDNGKGRKEKYKKSLRLTSEQIVNLNLTEGLNEVEFSVTTAYQGTSRCTCHIFLWNYDDKIVISDIDGTITKSDVLGHILPMVGHNWAQLGVAKLFTKVKNNGYKFLYLSARAIGQARITRDYLRSVRQGEVLLPDGPLLLSPTSLIYALHREVIEKKPEEFKISCLKDIQTLFPSCMGNPFYAGFGNKINDTWAYRAVGIPITRVFTINHRGELKLELIQTFQSSYTRLSDEVDHVFPPMNPCSKLSGNPTPIFSSPEEFSYFTYWRDPVASLSGEEMNV